METLIAQSIALVVLYVLYKVMLSRLTFFQLNRAVILLGATSILAFPLFDEFLKIGSNLPVFVQSIQLPTITALNDSNLEKTMLGSWNLMHFLKVGFWMVVVLNLAKITWSLIVTARIIQNSEAKQAHGHSYYLSDQSNEAFSFFKWIVLPTGLNESELKLLLKHEAVHVRQIHSLDRLVYGMVGSIMWFNPAVWFLRKELIATHEFLADQASSAEIGVDRYGNTLLELSMNSGPEILGATVNTFSNPSLTKTRFDMMNTKRSTSNRLWNYAILFPTLLAIMIMFNTEAQQALDQEKGNDWVHEKVEVMPEFPGGKKELFNYMIAKIKYPNDAEKAGVEGKVMVKFVVDVDGSIVNVQAKNSVYPSIDKQAIEVVSSMPKWTPGMQDGKAVKVEMVLPIAYKLTDKESPKKR